MERFWADTRREVRPSPLNLGIGVTAHSEADARVIIAEHFSDVEVERIRMISDLASLDEKHVQPNIGDHMRRGVWFPRQS